MTAKVYTAPSRKRGKSYNGYVAVFSIDGERHRICASTLEALAPKVKEVIRPLIGENDTLTLRGTTLRVYERAVGIATELGLEPDEALQRLRGFHKLTTAKHCSVEQSVDYYTRHHDQSKFGTPTPQVTDAFLDACKQAGNSKEDIDTMKGKLKRFAAAFGCPLCEISAEQYRAYFSAIAGSPRNKMNHRNTVRRLVNWAKDNGYLAFDHPGLPRYAGRVKIPPKHIEVFNIRQREELIKQASPVELPMTLIKAYTPIRQKEVGVSRWESIDWDVGIIMVWAEDAKKQEPRPIYLPRELCKRLRPLAQPNGKIYPYKSFYKVCPRLARKAGLKWIVNGWRTTTISHLQAAVNDLARVADEAGTSVKKMKSNYLKPLRPDTGRAYFRLEKGERHPIEPSYNANHYGADTTANIQAGDEAPNIVTVKFGGNRA